MNVFVLLKMNFPLYQKNKKFSKENWKKQRVDYSDLYSSFPHFNLPFEIGVHLSYDAVVFSSRHRLFFLQGNWQFAYPFCTCHATIVYLDLPSFFDQVRYLYEKIVENLFIYLKNAKIEGGSPSSTHLLRCMAEGWACDPLSLTQLHKN